MKRLVASLLVVIVGVADAGVIFAQSTIVTQPRSVTTAATSRSTRATTVLGTAWNADTQVIPNARVRLRNLGTGRVEGQATTNSAGEFQFTNIEGGTYVTELVDGKGNVAAIGETFTIAPGQTVVTFVRLRPKRSGMFGGLWGSAAAAALAAAAGLGITAVDECTCVPVSPELPKPPNP